MPTPIPGRYGTLANCLRDGTGIRARCCSCGRETWLDLQALIDRFGAEFAPGRVIKRFSGALRCTECRWRGADVELGPAGRPAGASPMGHHGDEPARP